MLGHVCQLNYHAGGRLVYRSSSGDLCHIPFLTAPHLCVGQHVSFSVSDGVAVEVKAVADPKIKEVVALASTSTAERTGSAEDAGQLSVSLLSFALPVESGPGRLAKRLQRELARFRNATTEEQTDLVSQAEEELQRLLEKDVLDGDALCRLVHRCAAWLRGPLAGDGGVAQHDGQRELGGADASKLQSRIRRLLIRALNSLDLNDLGTQQALGSAVASIQALLGQMDLNLAPAGAARRQWSQLQALLKPPQDAKMDPGQNDREGTTGTPRKHVRGADIGGVVDGAYHPNTKVRGMPAIFQDQHRIVRLQCQQCSESITSNWFFKHPRTDEIRVLVPCMGHAPCKRSPWVPPSGLRSTRDVVSNLNFCPHNRGVHDCALCGGRRRCPHNKRRDQCPRCKGFSRHRRTAAGEKK